MLYHAVTLSATGRWKDARRPYPANNVTLEVAQFTCATDIQRVLAPYLTGKGLPGRAHRVVALPTQAQIQRVLANTM